MAQALGAAGETKHKRFANGDTYIGGWKNGMPSGEGKYVWADGSVYTGGWKEGAKHGVGTYTWPSGATYHGEWQAGYMHGIGSFEAPDGSRYSGGWRQDVKHGLGKKTYANGDSYEGLWDSGRPHGPGRYIWADGNEYDGEWRTGRMDGQGTFVWSTGERYDGGWKEGREHGLGLFTFPDGATYRGFWEGGKKHGVGVARPPVPRPPAGGAPAPPGAPGDGAAGDGAHGGHGTPRAGGGGGGPAAAGGEQGEAAAPPAPAGGHEQQGGGHDMSPEGATDAGDGAQERQRAPAIPPGSAPSNIPQGMILVKEYDHGRPVRQSLLHASEALAILGKPDRVKLHLHPPLRQSKKMTTRLGQVVYKDNSSFDLMVGLQAGIRWSVTRTQAKADSLAPSSMLSSGPRPLPLPAAAFADKVVVPFPRAGSVDTPVHRASSDFEWRDYSPSVFRNLREAFGWQPSRLVTELCSDAALRLLNSPGKSGSVFFLSADDKLLVKTIRKTEFDLLRRLLPAYYSHMLAHLNSLLVKVYGLFSITSESSGNRKVRFVIMNNLFDTGLQIHERYDLKGSTLGRTAGKEAIERAKQGDPRVVLKDLDLGGQTFKLEAQWHDRLMEQIASDCALLESCGIMDYSMLLGVHDRSRTAGGRRRHQGQPPAGGGAANGGGRHARVSAASALTLDDEADRAASDEPWSGDEAPAGPAAAGNGGGGNGGAPEKEGPAGPAVNFEEHKAEDEAGLQRRMARVEARVQELDLGPEAKAGLLQLARVEMLANGPRGHGRRAGRVGAASALSVLPKRSDTLRPLAFADGASDALALSLGQSRVQLGAAMAATALPPGGEAAAVAAAALEGEDVEGGLPANMGFARDVVLFFGIIDIFTEYDSMKRLEHAVKAVGSVGRGGAGSVSAVPPGRYSKRFQDFMARVFC